MLEDKQNYEFTKYPKLYCDTYWGHYKYKKGYIGFEPNIIKNRDKFAEEYQLKNRIEKIALKYKEKEGVFKDHLEIKNFNRKNDGDKWTFLHERDERKGRHIEYYKTKNNKIISVFSPYDNSEYNTKIILESGYSLIYPLWNTSINTFVKEIT
jgi:hypothetical protein